MEPVTLVNNAIETFPIDGIDPLYYGQWLPLLRILDKVGYIEKQEMPNYITEINEALKTSCPTPYTKEYLGSENHPVDETNKERVNKLDNLANEVEEMTTSNNLDLKRLLTISDEVYTLIGTYNLSEVEELIEGLTSQSNTMVL